VHANSYGLPGLTIDGNDVLAVCEATRAAVDRARRGEGPFLIECKTYRWYFHAMRNTPPPETRPAAEIAEWKERDPITRLAADLIARRLISESDLGSLQRQVQADLQEAVAFADNSPFPDPKDILVDMFAV
jgi:pyruvate dehydrogenase E1 component alpha subunit